MTTTTMTSITIRIEIAIIFPLGESVFASESAVVAVELETAALLLVVKDDSSRTTDTETITVGLPDSITVDTDVLELVF